LTVRVVGAGVIGLSCAVRLLEAGAGVEVVAAELGPATTSAAAAALWYPYRAWPADRVRSWGRTTFAELVRLSADPATGVRLRFGARHLRVAEEPPDWSADVPGFTVSGGAPPYVASWTFAAPVVDTSVYLGWLASRVRALGGTVRQALLRSTGAALDGVDVAVLATGLGARTVPGDPSVHGGAGQVVRVSAPEVERWVLDEEHPDGLVYVIPRVHDVVCGGVDVAAVEKPAPDPALAEAILRRCAQVVPALAGARVLGHATGVRPVRPSVRLEREGDLVHCYGHGGAGYTLSWGCAGEVRDLVLSDL
jgi:D-amino-acid oxidase